MKPHTQLYQCTAILTFNIPSISVHDWMQSQVSHSLFKAGHRPVLWPFTTSGKFVCVAILRMPLGSAKGHLKSNLIEQFPISPREVQSILLYHIYYSSLGTPLG